MQLSIIIVNYNVKFFLEQCLCSVEKAIQNIIAEVYVVDNASKDGSIEYLQERFSFVKFIANEKNVGFARANNLAIKQCYGDYILFLNPDTILPEDCLEKCMIFLNEHKDCGALGIKMIDGCGKFLPESKRSFPSITTSFYKLAGLTHLFPKSKLFARYNLGYLNENENHEVDVLAGAFLMGRRELFVQLNGFDEAFFMYGEDIDLSYRIQKSGFKNYYFAESSIIHFKGESTKKGTLNYVRMFYRAMSIFVKKHYSGGISKLFTLFIEIAIWLRAAVTAVLQFSIRLGLPLLDIIIILGSFKLVNDAWVKYVRGGLEFKSQIVNIALPGFTLIFLFAASLAGIYDNKYKPKKTFFAAGIAVVIMLAVYALLPDSLRFSRAVILLGGLTASMFIILFRLLLVRWRIVDSHSEEDRTKKTIVVGSLHEYENVLNLLSSSGLAKRVLGRIAAQKGARENVLGDIQTLPAILTTAPIKEVIFCEGELSFSAIINQMQVLSNGLSIKIHARKSTSIVGSDSKNAAGESVSAEGNYNINQPYQRRMKRMVDIFFSTALLLTFPIQLILAKGHLLKQAIEVLFRKKTWIGYAKGHPQLPKIPVAVLSPAGIRVNKAALLNSSYSIDLLYAKEYDWRHDVKLLIKHYVRK